MKRILLALLLIPTLAGAAQQEITVVPDNPVIPSIGSLKDAINLRLADIDENFDEIYPIITAGPVYVNPTAPADTKVVWIDTDQDNAIKVYIGGGWTAVGTAGSGDNLGSAAYTDVVALWTTCTGYLKSDGTCDTPSGSATYPSAAGVANWNGSAWGTSYAVGTAANDLVQLNASAQLPAVSADLLTITDTGLYFTTDTVAAALQQLGSFDASLPALTIQTSSITTGATNILGSDYGLIADTDGDGLPNKIDVGDGLVKVSSNVTAVATAGTDYQAAGTNKVTTASKATNYTIGTDSAAEAYGGTVYVTSEATITAPAVAVGMSFSVVTIGAIAVSLDVNASDRMILDGVASADGDKATNQSTAGDTITCQYESADGWFCWSGSMHATNKHWSDTN